MHFNIGRREWLAALSASGLASLARGAEPATLSHVGTFTLLGNSVRVVAREVQEVMFKDVGMDDIAVETARLVLRSKAPLTKISAFRAPKQVNVDEQLAIGNAAALRGSLPDWVEQRAASAALSHVLLINSNQGAMEFRTAMTQVVGSQRVTGIGFFVGASGRTKNLETGAVSSGYLAPFVQLRITLVEAISRRVVHSAMLSEGFIVGPPEPEAPDPWRFLSRPEKAQALQQLLKGNIQRGVEAVLQPL